MVEKEETVFLIMGIITVTFVPGAVPVMKMHGAQCMIHTPYHKKRKCMGVYFLQHPFDTKVPHDKDCSPHRKPPHKKVESKGVI